MDFNKILDRISSNKPDYVWISLEPNEQLSVEKLRALNSSLKLNEFIGEVSWPIAAPNNNEVVESLKSEIEKKIKSNNMNYQSSPSDFTHLLLCFYTHRIDGDSRVSAGDKISLDNELSKSSVQFTSKQVELMNQLLANWRILKLYRNGKYSSYFGGLYANERSGQLVLCHSGLVFKLKNFLDDEINHHHDHRHRQVKPKCVEFACIELIAQQYAAFQVTRECLAVAEERAFHLSVTGYGLGGFLAQLSSYFAAHDLKTTSSSDRPLKSVTFDSPGTSDLSSSSFDFSGFDFRHLDSSEFLSRPNLINCSNRHVSSRIYKLNFSLSTDVNADDDAAAAAEMHEFVDFFRQLPHLGAKFEERRKQVCSDLRVVFGLGIEDLVLNFMRNNFYEAEFKPKDLVVNWPLVEHKVNEEAEIRKRILDLIRSVTFRVNQPKSSELFERLHKNFAFIPLIDFLVESLLQDRVDFDKYTLSCALDEGGRAFYLKFEGKYELADADYRRDALNRRNAPDRILYNLKRRTKPIETKPEGMSLLILEQVEELRTLYEIERSPRRRACENYFLRAQSKFEINQLRELAKRLASLEPGLERRLEAEINNENTSLEDVSQHRYSLESYLLANPVYTFERKHLMRELGQKVRRSEIVVVCGSPGIGKSSLVLAYAAASESAADFGRARYINAKSEQSLLDAYREVVGAGVGGRGSRPEILEKFKSVINRQSSVTLLIYDSVQVANFDRFVCGLSPKKVKIIAITSQPLELASAQQYEQVQVDAFSKQEFADYFRKQYREEVTDQVLDKIYSCAFLNNGDSATEECCCFEPSPLNINRVIALLENTNPKTFEKSLNELANRLRRSDADLFEFKFYEKILRNCRHREVAPILFSCTLFDPDQIDCELLLDSVANLNAKVFHKCLRFLGENFLLTINESRGDGGELFLRMHWLSQAQISNYFKAKMGQNRVNVARLNLIKILNKKFSSLHQPRIASHLIYAAKNFQMSLSEDDDNDESAEHVCSLYSNLAKYYADNFEFRQSIEFYEKAIGFYEKALATKVIRTTKSSRRCKEDEQETKETKQLQNFHVAILKDEMAQVYSQLGEYEKALDAYQQSLDVYIQFFDDFPDNVAETLANIGQAYSNLGRVAKAVEYFQQSFETYEQIYGQSVERQAAVAKLFERIGSAYSKGAGSREERERTLEYLRRAHEIRVRVHSAADSAAGGGNEELIESLDRIAAAHESLAQFEMAIDCYTRSIDMFRRVHRVEEHAQIARRFGSISAAYESMGSASESTSYARLAYEMFKRVHASEPDHIEVANALASVGNSLCGKGEYSKALQFYEKSLSIMQRNPQATHLDLAMALNNSGVALNLLGKHSQVEL